MKQILVFLIRVYKTFYKNVLRYYFPSHCRFYPTCTDYAIDAVNKRGAFRGGLLSIRRVVKCNPFSKGGYDFLE